MKKVSIHKILLLLLLGVISSSSVYAQYMPVVFDKVYGNKNKIHLVTSLGSDEVAMVGKEGQNHTITWIDREGEVVFTIPLAGFTSVNQLSELDNGCILLVGQSNSSAKKDRKDITLCGRALVLDRSGKAVTNIYAGSQGSEFLKGTLLKSGSFMLAGTEPQAGASRQGSLMKVTANGDVAYQYRNVESGYCAHFEVFGNTTEYVVAAFSADREKERAAVVRLDDKGKPYYITPLPAGRFTVNGINSNISDGSVIVAGDSPAEGGVIYKIRPEGDVVFGKSLIPASGSATLNHLHVARNGNILVGGTGVKGYYALLRNDGTSLYSGMANGAITGIGMNVSTGESVITTYDEMSKRGTFVRIAASGKAEFERTIDGNFNTIRVNNNSDILLISAAEGRVSMYSQKGEKEFDRYITGNQPEAYRQAVTAVSGEVVFLGGDNRLVKLGHGLYVSDVKITKPINGTATAVFTVTLTGYATTKEGAPLPVSVQYGTREVSASIADNFVPVQGKLSFTPSRGVADRYLVKQEIEVPVKANNFIEGIKEFELSLSGVQHSYLVKPVGRAVIEDQQSVVKLIRTENGIEGSKDILYELGLFKTDGTPLTNSTGANIIVDGIYGEGTADALDFDMGLTPRIILAHGTQRATFSARTLEDTRYELPKTVVINFNRIYNLSGSNVSFEGDLLSCSGVVIDQAAEVIISSLGDHRLNNNVVSGFFTVSLRRASDGALQTNNTGNDIVVNCELIPDASAKEGKDFVFTNMHDIRISGDGNHTSANVNGVVLYTKEADEKQVKLRLKSVGHPAGAQPIGVSAAENAAQFNILR